MVASNKRACIYTLGCRLNQSESGLIAERLQRAGYELVHGAADLYVINTCTVTAEADAKSRKMIRAFIRRNPEAFVAVVGCYSQLHAEAIASIPGVDLVIGNAAKLDILDYVHETKNDEPVIISGTLSKDDFTIEAPLAPGPSPQAPLLTHRPNLKIQEGCDCMCSYCIVPFARGKPRSRAMEDLLKEARALIVRGAREIVLSGINVGAYAYQGMTLIDVIDLLNDEPGIERIRIGSIELTTLRDGEHIIDRMRDPGHALAPFLHIPLQSGSDRILQSMNRNHSVSDFRAFVECAAEVVPDLCIGTDILVGFPGERNEDFEATCRLLEESPVAYAHVFKYSERKGTRAAEFPNMIPAKTLNARSEAVRRVSDGKRRAFHHHFLGRTMDVLFEQQGRGSWQGYTANYILVAAPSKASLANRIVPVRLSGDGGAFMSGTITKKHSDHSGLGTKK